MRFDALRSGLLAVVVVVLASCRHLPVQGPSIGAQPIDVLPIELFGDRLPFVLVRVDASSPLAFILDTGADNELLNGKWAKPLSLKVENARSVEQPGGAVEMGIVRGVHLGLGRVSMPDHLVVTAPLGFLEPFIGHPLDGLLGHSFLMLYVVEIDYARRTLSVFDPRTYHYLGPGRAVPLTFGETDAFVHATLLQPGQVPVDAKLELDTGSFDALGLHGAFIDEHALVPKGQPRIPLLGLAIGGETTGYRTRLQGIELGGFRIEQPVVSVVTSGDGAKPSPIAGTLGADVLYRFKVVLDYAHARMILEPNTHLADPSEYDMAGMMLMALGDDFHDLRVHAVLPDSPAAAAGIRDGDRITSVDGQPAAQLTLEEVAMRLRRPGAEIKLGLARGSDTLAVTVHLARLI